MTWWGYLILGASAVLIIVLLLTRRKTVVHGLTDEERQKLLDLDKERLKEELEIERREKEKLAEIANSLKLAVDEREQKLKVVLERIDAEEREDLETFNNDPAAAMAALDELLGISSDKEIASGDEKPCKEEEPK